MHDEDLYEEEQILGAAILTKPIRALNLQPPITVPRGMSISEAVSHMVENGVGCLLIEDGGRLAGIFTERDVLRKVVPARLDAERTAVEAVMTANPETLSPDDVIAYALNKMSLGGFRHVPLVDKDGRPVAVVSMRDVVDFMVDLFPTAVHNLPPEPGLGISRTREGA